MDMVVPKEDDQEFPRKYDKSEETNLGRNSLRTKVLIFIGAHEFFSPEVALACFMLFLL